MWTTARTPVATPVKVQTPASPASSSKSHSSPVGDLTPQDMLKAFSRKSVPRFPVDGESQQSDAQSGPSSPSASNPTEPLPQQIEAASQAVARLVNEVDIAQAGLLDSGTL